MRIDAITCCSGELYAGQLDRSLEVWCNTLDSLVVVTKPGDPALDVLEPYEREFPHVLRHITTSIFTEYGADFNKGAALCEAYRACDPNDWALHFDSDIIPPDDWREQAEPLLEIGRLHGCRRLHEDGHPADEEKPFYPYGFFQLWHVTDPHSWRWPIFDVWHPHCGSYDANFMDQWKGNWRELPFNVVHQGEPRTNWFGDAEDGAEKMDKLKKRGLRRYRMDCNRGLDRLPVPKPRLEYRLNSVHPMHWGRDVIRACMIGGPFLVAASRDRRLGAQRIITHRNKFTQIQEEVLACIASSM